MTPTCGQPEKCTRELAWKPGDCSCPHMSCDAPVMLHPLHGLSMTLLWHRVEFLCRTGAFSHTMKRGLQLVSRHRCLLGRACRKLHCGCRMQQVESSDDDEHFRKKEAKRTERDTARLRPLILGVLPASISAHDKRTCSRMSHAWHIVTCSSTPYRQHMCQALPAGSSWSLGTLQSTERCTVGLKSAVGWKERMTKCPFWGA